MLSNNILYASGILYYSRSIDQTLYFLLGRDHDNKWSNFGGGCELIDKSDHELTAAREAWEETLGAVYDYEQIKHIIKNKGNKLIISKTPSGRKYYMYIIKIPFTTTYRDKFISTKKFISNITVDKKFLEINDIKWVSIDTIRSSLETRKSFIKLRYVFEQSLNKNMDEILKSCYNG
jgi:8-oxo-dGTP pyrophosphatase MutT (NUDIX family)